MPWLSWHCFRRTHTTLANELGNSRFKVENSDFKTAADGERTKAKPWKDIWGSGQGIGSINRIYGVPGRVEPARNYRGTYGFITD
jgi:hypothetical protein